MYAQRVAGAVVGSAVGDALGAPFEFGPPLAFSARFGASSGEMCGGGGWDPGEATDDTQTALLVAESLLDRHGVDSADMFGRFQRWAGSEPKEIGLQTEAVLTSGRPWDLAAADYYAHNERAAGNGSLMRTTTAAVFFTAADRQTTMDARRGLADARFGHLGGTRHHHVRAAVGRAIDLGGDTDTMACVTGGLAGALHGVEAIPDRWTAPLFVPLPGFGSHRWSATDLRDLAGRLVQAVSR
jgi:ADP-ribosylglycohydrolase